MHPNGMQVSVVCVIGRLDRLLASLQEAVRSGQLRKKEKSTGKLDLTTY